VSQSASLQGNPSEGETEGAADVTYRSPERSHILELYRVPVTVAELAAAVGLLRQVLYGLQSL
jgi:hypothetical protein